MPSFNTLNSQAWIQHHHSQTGNYKQRPLLSPLPHPGSATVGANCRHLKMAFYFNKPDDKINSPIWIFKDPPDWPSKYQ